MDPSEIPGTPSAAQAEALDIKPLDLRKRKTATRIKAGGVWIPMHRFGGGFELLMRTLANNKLKHRLSQVEEYLKKKIKDPDKRKKGILDGPLGEEYNRQMLLMAIAAIKGSFLTDEGLIVFDGTEDPAKAREFVEASFLPRIEIDNPGESEDYDTQFLSDLLQEYGEIEKVSAEDLERVGPTYFLSPAAALGYSD